MAYEFGPRTERDEAMAERNRADVRARLARLAPATAVFTNIAAQSTDFELGLAVLISARSGCRQHPVLAGAA